MVHAFSDRLAAEVRSRRAVLRLTQHDLAKLAGENILRVMRQAEEVASRLQRQRAPSTATIEQMDRKG